MLEADGAKHMEVKENVTREYYRRVKKILKSKLNGGNVINAINTRTVAIIRYGAGIIKWTKEEFRMYSVRSSLKKYFFAILYRSPSQAAVEIGTFTKNFDEILSRMSAENPYAVIITGDFNCRLLQWWENDIEKEDGKIFEPHTTELGLHELISEATHIMVDSKSCIDLISIDQPNLFLESGAHPSLHEQCHHQIVYGELSVKNLVPPTYYRKVGF